MSDTQVIKSKGSCLCGEIHFTAHTASTSVGACHCGTCRRWGGGPFMGVECGTRVDFEGVETLSIYDSSDWAERGFCGNCGTHVFYRLKESGQYHIPAGLLDSESSVHFDHQVFIDQKPAYYEFANATNNMTGEELFALFSSEENSEQPE